jgi:hypothetical protein
MNEHIMYQKERAMSLLTGWNMPALDMSMPMPSIMPDMAANPDILEVGRLWQTTRKNVSDQ